MTDIAKFNNSEPGQVVRNYFRNKGNIDFLGAWEKLHNENFNYVEFDVIRAAMGSASGQELVKHLEPSTKIRQLGTAKSEEEE